MPVTLRTSSSQNIDFVFGAIFLISDDFGKSWRKSNRLNVPHHKAGLSADIEEERRLFYVALTRAKDRLHVAAVRERYHRKTDVSRFIGEAGL